MLGYWIAWEIKEINKAASLKNTAAPKHSSFSAPAECFLPWLEIRKDLPEFPHQHPSGQPHAWPFLQSPGGWFCWMSWWLTPPEGAAEMNLFRLSSPCSSSKDREVKAKSEALPGFELPLQYYCKDSSCLEKPEDYLVGNQIIHST